MLQKLREGGGAHSPFRPPEAYRDVTGVKIGVNSHGESIFEVSRPLRGHLVAKNCEKCFGPTGLVS